MSTEVSVIDYGAGNMLNVVRALEHCGANVQVVTSAADIAQADRLVLPGVGAFADGMSELKRLRLVEPVIDYTERGRPFLGICLGMQMMLATSCEFGEHTGLGLIPGEVKPIPANGTDGRPHKVPHIGWSELKQPGAGSGEGWRGSILDGCEEGDAVYFVHSFMAAPEAASDLLAVADYNGVEICAAIQRGSMFGCQFHPEKSGETGLRILQRFLKV